MKEKELLHCLCILQRTYLLFQDLPVNPNYLSDKEIIRRNILKVVKSMESSFDV